MILPDFARTFYQMVTPDEAGVKAVPSGAVKIEAYDKQQIRRITSSYSTFEFPQERARSDLAASS